MIFIALKIFLARILDVSIGTVRSVLSVKGHKYQAAVLAFFEVLIWFFVAREALNIPFSLIVPLAYSLGYATGTFIGGLLSDLIIKDNLMLLVITKRLSITYYLEKNGIRYSSLSLNNSYDDYKRLLLVIYLDNKKRSYIVNKVKNYDKEAIITYTNMKLAK